MDLLSLIALEPWLSLASHFHYTTWHKNPRTGWQTAEKNSSLFVLPALSSLVVSRFMRSPVDSKLCLILFWTLSLRRLIQWVWRWAEHPPSPFGQLVTIVKNKRTRSLKVSAGETRTWYNAVGIGDVGRSPCSGATWCFQALRNKPFVVLKQCD